MMLRLRIRTLAAAAAILTAGPPASAQYLTDPLAPPPTRVQAIAKAVVWSPDGRYQAVAYGKPAGAWGDAMAVVIVDAANGSVLRKLTHEGDDIETVAWSPNGRFLASGTRSVVRVWDVASGTTVGPEMLHGNDVHSVAWSPDGRFLASGSSDKLVRIFDAASGKTVRTLTAHSATVWSVTWSPDGRYIASGGGYPPHNNRKARDTVVRIFDAASGDLLSSLTGHSNVVESVAWSPDGRLIASGSRDNSVRIWDVASGKAVHTLAGSSHDLVTTDHTLAGHSHDVTSVAWRPDGRFLASGSADRTLRIWDAASGKSVRAITENGPVHSVAWSPDGSALASSRRVHANVMPPLSVESTPRQSSSNQYAALAQSGQARFEKRDYAGAEADFTKALATSPPAPARADLHYARAYTRYLQRQPDRAAEDLDAALKLKADARAYSLRGRIRLEQQNFAASRDDLGRALELGPPGAAGRAEAHYLRARAEIGLGDRDAAVRDLSAAIGQTPRVDFYFERANLYRETGAEDKALADYGVVLRDENAPAFMRTRAHLGRALIHHARRDAGSAMADYDAFFAGLPAADAQTRAFGTAIIQRLTQAGLYSGSGETYNAALRSALARCVATPACVF